jgi:hypothetical protein
MGELIQLGLNFRVIFELVKPVIEEILADLVFKVDSFFSFIKLAADRKLCIFKLLMI